MSKAEKARSGVKPVKLPSSVFSEWDAIVKRYHETCQPPKEPLPITATLMNLMNSQDEPWEQQANYLKEIGKGLRKLGTLSPDQQSQLDNLVEPVMVAGYFGITENMCRRHFIPLITTSSQCLRARYRDYIRGQVVGGHTVGQQALTILATLEFATGRQIVLEMYEETLDRLVQCLEDCQTRLKAVGKTFTLVVADLMSDIQLATKTTLALLSRHDIIAMHKVIDKALLARLLESLFEMCARTDVYVKDCCQVAGMTIAAILNLEKGVHVARNLALGWFFIEDYCDDVSGGFGVAPPAALVEEESGWKGENPPMLSVVRGLASCVRKEVLLSPVSDALKFRPPLKSYGPVYNLQELLFHSINYFCSNTELEAQSKIAAFESMVSWLSETKVMLKTPMPDNDATRTVGNIFQPKTTDRLINYVWNHWDDPIDVIQHKVKAIFESVLDVLELKAGFFHEEAQYKEFLLKLLKNLINMDWHRKAKYALLNLLVLKLGTDTFLEVEPRFLWKCLRSMDSLILAPQITALFLGFLYRRVEETIPGHPKLKGQNAKLKQTEDTKIPIQRWIELWAVPVLKCLTSPSELLRKNVNGFILQPLFKLCPQSFWYLMSILQSEQDACWQELNRKMRLHAFVAVLKVARSLDIVDGDAYTLDHASPESRKISVNTLKLAIYHLDPQVRLDVLGLLCESRKATSGVSKIELDMLKLYLPLNMNCTSPEFRQNLSTHISRLLVRLRGNLYAQLRTYRSCMTFLETKAEGRSPDDMQRTRDEAREAEQSIEHGKEFLYWFLDHINTSLYPGASFQRVATALRLLNVFIRLFGVDEMPIPPGFTVRPEFPFKLPVGSPVLTKLLLDTLMNPYDLNRDQAFEILNQFPKSLPGLESRQDVQDLLWWGLDNVVSTRAGDSTSGAMIFRLIFTKYVMELGYDLYPERNAKDEKLKSVELAPVVFTERLLDLLTKQVTAAKDNLLVAAQQYPMHGTLLALQYVFRELQYDSATVQKHLSEWRKTHLRALSMIHSVCNAVTEVLSNPSPEGNVPASFREMEETIDNLIEECDDEDDAEESSGPKHQVILSCCWRAVKEASALMEVLVARAPIRSDEKNSFISFADIVDCGKLLRVLLTTIRHRGAFSAVYPAYVTLNSRLLDSMDPAISKLPAEWLEENLASLTSSNISITRRSAGLPLCILAIISSERLSKKTLLDKTMKRLFKLAAEAPPADADQRIDLPQVHAFNILRTIFMDAKLATNVLPYASDGFSLAISGFSSSSWAIRNCAVMLFSTLLQRTFGTKKTKDEHSNVNKLTGREFFTRYPQLHPYLLKRLNVAVEQLLTHDAASSVHPGLYPILTLLSRLHPSVMDGADQVTSMSAFVPMVRSCAVSSIFKTREMAARALVPLIASSDIVRMVLDLLAFPKNITQNEIHGRLLQVQFLLRGHLYQPNLREVLFDFVQEVPSSLINVLEVGRTGRLSNMSYALCLDIIGEFFYECTWISADRDQGVVQDLLSLSKEQLQSFRTAVLEQCVQGLSIESIDHPVIGGYLVRQAMANIVVLSALKGYKDNMKLTDVLYLLDDRDYEVRLTTMQRLESHIGNMDVCIIKKEDADEDVLRQRLLQKTYEGEQNLNCFVLATKLLLSLQSNDLSEILRSVPFTLQEYWNRLVGYFDVKCSQSVIESVLPLLGALTAQILRSGRYDSDWIKSCVSVWSRHVAKYSHKETPLQLREATVESLRFMAKAVLTSTNTEISTTAVRLAMTQLLQDDDIDIRNTMATIVSEALALEAPVLSERATELVYINLSEQSTEPVQLQSALMDTLLGEKSLQTTCDEELHPSKVLFAKENPNIYKEDIIDVQWAFVVLDRMHLKGLSKMSLWVDRGINVIQDVLVLCRVLTKLSDTLMRRGPFGVASRPNLFLAAYRYVLAASLAVNAYCDLELGKREELLPLIQELDTAMRSLREGTVHPLLWQLLCGDAGLSYRICQFLRRTGAYRYRQMYLLSPDSRGSRIHTEK